MSPVWLFLVGTLVTLVVAVGLSLPIYGAILDGRDEARRREADAERTLRVIESGHRPAA